MIALGWSQQLDPGRARTVRRALLDAVVPVMLVPTAPEGRDVGPYQQTEPPLSHTSMRVYAVCLDAGSALAPPSLCAGWAAPRT